MEIFYFYGVAATAYLVTSWSFSAIRWWHTCRAPKDKLEYIWPDRKLQVLLFLQATWLLPYIINPASESAWLLEKLYFPATYYFYCGLLLLCFFSTVKQRVLWKTVSWVSAAIVIAVMLPLVLDAWLPFDLMNHSLTRAWHWVVLGESLVMMVYSGAAMWQVKKWMDEARDANYSNPDDFPADYAHRVWLAPVLFTPLLWPAFAMDSPKLMAVENILLSVSNIVLLLNVMPIWRRAVILSTHDDEEPNSAAEEQGSDEQQNALREARFKQTAEEIENYVVKKKAFLNVHLKIDDVLEYTTMGRTYVSQTFSQHFGGFANYVNHHRLLYYDQLMAEDATMTKETAATNAGFSSYNAYYKAKIKEEKNPYPVGVG